MGAPQATYESIRTGFSWSIPSHLNMGVLCADRHPPEAAALIDVRGDSVRRYTFGDLTTLSNQFANALLGLGLTVGDRIAVLLPQQIETGVSHVAIYKLGAIAIPMSILFGPQALAYRLRDAEARAVITDAARLDAVTEVTRDMPDIKVIVVDADNASPHEHFWTLVRAASSRFEPANTTPETPGLLIYTSGTTGPPKGVLHGHRVLLGHLPGFQLSHNHFPAPNDLFWTPADWAWIGGLLDALMPSWFFGKPIVAAAKQRFDPEWALSVMNAYDVRNAFLPPTALKMMRQLGDQSPAPRLRSVMSGGEALGEEMLSWAQERLGVTVNEIYGQTEANYVVGNCHEVWPIRPGSMGRAYPGHDVAIVGDDGAEVAAGELGEVAVGTNDPVVFLGYWNQPAATREKLTEDGGHLLTGDLARADEDGYLWFESRKDDLIMSAGYRIGPAEIEECLMSHPAVAMAAAIGIPDEVRGEVVKAFVQLVDADLQSPALKDEIKDHVRLRLASYEYPRQVEFVEELPLTTTGKIRRRDLRQLEEERAFTAEPVPTEFPT